MLESEPDRQQDTVLNTVLLGVDQSEEPSEHVVRDFDPEAPIHSQSALDRDLGNERLEPVGATPRIWRSLDGLRLSIGAEAQPQVSPCLIAAQRPG